jgi:two-component SAPR family response regulator
MAYDLGANDFLIKPVTFEALTRAIEAIGHFWIVFNVNE